MTEGRGPNEDDDLRMHSLKGEKKAFFFFLPEAENVRNKGRIIISAVRVSHL